LINDMNDSKKGMMNLCKHPNYKDDINFTSQIETILDKIDSIINECRELYPHLEIKSNTTQNTPYNTHTNTPQLSPRNRSVSLQ